MSMPLLLVADDVPDNRVILATMLEFHGFAVQQAQNGSEAVRMAGRDHPALILMDIEMPVMDGWEAARLLKQDAQTAAIPIVAVTAADLRADFHRLGAGGFCAYLQKPFSPHRILEVVTLCLRASEEGRPWIDLGHVDIGVRHPQR
ncbi:MAG TPA: response regulator [Longimicrobiaceae bacterium]|nr:response regulator [Longimicrobiaceae bacterium]